MDASAPFAAPGLERLVARWLIPAYLLGIALPWIGAAWIKTRYQPGLVDDPQPLRDLIDIFAMGFTLIDAIAVFTVAIGCLVVTLMKGPVRYADAAPCTRPAREPRERDAR